MASHPPSPARTHTSDTTYQDSIFPTPSTSPWSSPKAFTPSPWSFHGAPPPHPSLNHHHHLVDLNLHNTSPPSPPHRCMASVVKNNGKILSLEVSDAGLVYAGTESKSIRIWKLPGFVDSGRLKSGSGVVEAVLVSSEHDLVFTAHSDCKIRVWSSTNGHSRKGTLPSLKQSLIKSIFTKASSTSTSSSSSSNSNKVKHSGAITALAYNTGVGILYSASMDNTIKVWNVGDMRCVETIHAHDDGVNAIAIGPDGLLFSGSEDTTVKIWKRSIAGSCYYHALLFYLQQQRAPVKAMAVGGGGEEEGDGYVLYAGCGDGYFHYWKKKGRTAAAAGFGQMSYMGFVRGHGSAILCMAAVERVVVTASADASVKVWRRDGKGGGGGGHQCTAVLGGHMAPVRGVVVRLDGENGCFVYSGSVDGSVKQWWVWREGGGGGGGDDDYFEISSPVGRSYSHG